jgi:hypothetical protein
MTTKGSYQDLEGREYLLLELEEWEAHVYHEQKMIRYGLVYLGADWEDRTQAWLPADPENGRLVAYRIRGATDDPEIVETVRGWLEEIRRGEENDR